MVPEVTCTGTEVLKVVVETMISVPEVPTVNPEATVLLALSLSSARAAVPFADGVAVKGTPERVATLLEIENRRCR